MKFYRTVLHYYDDTLPLKFTRIIESPDHQSAIRTLWEAVTWSGITINRDSNPVPGVVIKGVYDDESEIDDFERKLIIRRGSNSDIINDVNESIKHLESAVENLLKQDKIKENNGWIDIYKKPPKGNDGDEFLVHLYRSSDQSKKVVIAKLDKRTFVFNLNDFLTGFEVTHFQSVPNSPLTINHPNS